MRVTRLINEDLIKLQMDTVRDLRLEEEYEGKSHKLESIYRERIVKEMVALLSRSEKIGHTQKLFVDLLNREKKAPTAIGHCVAVPHVRTMQAKVTVMGFMRSRDGLPYGAPDGKDVHLFFPVVGPPYDDKVYLRIYKRLGELLLQETTFQRFMGIEYPGEVIRILGEEF